MFFLSLGNAISTVIFTLDPEIIILGGSISNSYKFIKPAFEKVLFKFPYKNYVLKLKIEVGTLPQVAILGVAALYYESIGAASITECIKPEENKIEIKNIGYCKRS